MRKPIPIEFGEWLPDLPARNNPGALVATNVIPQLKGYRSLKSLQSFSNALTNVCLGAFWAQDSSNTVNNFAGDVSKLYRLNAGVTWVDETGTSGPYNASNWDFTKFGDRIIAANDQDPLQYWDLGVSTNFADLPGSPPNAARIATVRNFVMLGDIPSLGPNFIKWSGYNNSEVWAASLATQSDRSELRGKGGRVQRIVPGKIGIIFQEHAIWRAIYSGPPRIFDIDEDEQARGTPAPNSVTWLGGTIWYYGWDDFYRLDAGVKGSKPIGANRIARWFKNNAAADALDSMRGAVDRRNQLIFWAFKSSSSAPINDKLIVYNWAANKWACAEVDTEVIAEYVSPGFTLDELDVPLSAGIDIDSIPVESSQYLGGAVNIQAFNSAHQAATFDGSALSATLDTKELDAGNERIIVNGIRPMVESDGSASVTVALGTRNSLNETPAFSTARAVNPRSGVADMRSNARYNRARIQTTGDFEQATGVNAHALPIGGSLG